METLPVNIEDSAMTVAGLKNQIQLIQQAMKDAMKENEHFGTIPGTPKPTLLKPGAEKLCLLFRLDPDYEILTKVEDKDFIAFTVKCRLSHIHSGVPIASGIGSCNSRETKYRYRSENTGQPVPKEYWDTRDKELLGGSQYTTRKKDGRWYIFEQIENDNPWDVHNTIVKMACKRALVAATLNATAASDIFTQDLEDMPASVIGVDTEMAQKASEKPAEKPKYRHPTEEPAPPGKPSGPKQPGRSQYDGANARPPTKDYKPDPTKPASEKQLQAIFNIGTGKRFNLSETSVQSIMEYISGGDELNQAQASLLISDFEQCQKEYEEAIGADQPPPVIEPDAVDDVPF